MMYYFDIRFSHFSSVTTTPTCYAHRTSASHSAPGGQSLLTLQPDGPSVSQKCGDQKSEPFVTTDGKLESISQSLWLNNLPIQKRSSLEFSIPGIKPEQVLPVRVWTGGDRVSPETQSTPVQTNQGRNSQTQRTTLHVPC